MTLEEQRLKRNQYAKAWRDKNREKYNAYQRQYGLEYRNRPGVKDALRASQIKFKQQNPLAPKAYGLTHYYGIGLQEFNQILKRQSGVCAICKRLPQSGKTFHVDHDHTCCPTRRACGKCIRGLLCENCNMGLGQFKENLVLLESAVEYMKTNK